MTDVSEAYARILARLPRWPVESVPLQAAHGRVLRAPVVAERDQPPFDRVTMDGIAIASRDFAAGRRRFSLAGTQAAGAQPLALGAPGQCVRIMTGAIRPDGADAVVPVERIRIDAGHAVIADDTAVTAGQHIHRQGSDGRRGETLLAPGIRIGPAEIAVIASAGLADVPVAAQPRVAVISTGDELVDVGAPIEPQQIRSTNDLAIAAGLAQHQLGLVTRARLRDDETELLDAIGRLHAAHDVLILSGGVSMGDFDYVPAVLERLGIELVFHRIDQKPGRPMWFGVSADGKPVFALPGNPVSTLVCVTRYLIPALRHAAGEAGSREEWIVLDSDVTAPPGLTYFIAVALTGATDGVARAEPRPTNTSGDFVSLAATDGIAELPSGRDVHPSGTVARLYRW